MWFVRTRFRLHHRTPAGVQFEFCLLNSVSEMQEMKEFTAVIQSSRLQSKEKQECMADDLLLAYPGNGREV